MAVFLLSSTFHNILYLPIFSSPPNLPNLPSLLISQPSQLSQSSQPSLPSQTSQKNFLLSLPFTKDIPTLYEERRISEQSPKYNRLIIISKPEKYTTLG